MEDRESHADAQPERDPEPDRERGPERDRDRRTSLKLPAGLEGPGRADDLASSPESHPSGARIDHRHSVPGTGIPGGPAPAADAGESERIRDAVTKPSDDSKRSDD